MTLHTTALSLFASTIASGLGLAVTASTLVSARTNSLSLMVGLALVLLGPAVFLGVASRAVRGDRAMLKVVFGAFLAGVTSVWFWLVPAQTAVMTVACHYDNFSACEGVVAQGGFAGNIALTNDAFVLRQCESAGKASYCRMAAAKRLSHPHRFCGYLSPDDAFEVVEWCTASSDRSALVARR